MIRLTPEQIAARCAQDIPDGAYVNLGIGMPTEVANHVPADREVIYHSENGVLGFGAAPEPGTEDPDLINASKQYVTMRPGGAFFHHADSFGMMRGGHIDISVLGAFQVAANGDLANWSTGSETYPPAVGGAMDLAVGAKRLFVITRHTLKDGTPKLVERCTYPLTGAGVVSRIYTDLAVIDVTPAGLRVVELLGDSSFDEVQALTGTRLLARDVLRTGAGS
ncbi:3-oxoacid CoA-transferase subunit B [Salinisphaera aquimarina]|uniref:3-oxoacid CoA-transferase subunit B n=1 Tax=Salinisphaera aquimarina TaxID=2094031 RepID=A0ABV7EP02_9GAMM